MGGGRIKEGGCEDLEEYLREVKKSNITVVVLLILVVRINVHARHQYAFSYCRGGLNFSRLVGTTVLHLEKSLLDGTTFLKTVLQKQQKLGTRSSRKIYWYCDKT
jgi:hypothetical protein